MTDAACRVLGLTLGTDFALATASTSNFPQQVDLSFPRYLILNVSVVGNQSEQVWTEKQSNTFWVPYEDSNFGDIQSWTEAENYEQADLVTDSSFTDLEISWTTPDSLANPYFSFDGIDHQLLFEIGQEGGE